MNNNDTESLTIEILSEKKKRNTLINALYRPPNGQIESFEKMFSRTKKSGKLFHIDGDFNLNLLDHDTNRNLRIKTNRGLTEINQAN